ARSLATSRPPVLLILLLASSAASIVDTTPSPACCACPISCKSYPASLIRITTISVGAHPFDDDVIDTSGEWASRVFSCERRREWRDRRRWRSQVNCNTAG
ncbi:hypothetical protein PMAYCL1PPCAC_32300, partial [Pristionchus mayeri]